MIFLNFIEPIDDDWIQWKEKCRIETNELCNSFELGVLRSISNLYGEQRKRYHEFPFFGKCAYCESKIEISSPTYVEHYRPKKGVRDKNNNIIMIEKNGYQIPHPGYLWLAYDWKNLLPVCWQCNTWHKDEFSGKMLGKGNRFPIEGQYATKSGEEINEYPLLINPVFEDPEEHLKIDELGIIYGVPGSTKGHIAIEVFGLNTREPLVNARRREYTIIHKKVQLIYSLNNAKEIEKEMEELKKIVQGQEAYTMAAKKAIADVLNSINQIQKSISSL